MADKDSKIKYLPFDGSGNRDEYKKWADKILSQGNYRGWSPFLLKDNINVVTQEEFFEGEKTSTDSQKT